MRSRQPVSLSRRAILRRVTPGIGSRRRAFARGTCATSRRATLPTWPSRSTRPRRCPPEVGRLSVERKAAFDQWARRGAGAKMEEAHEHAGKQVLNRIEIGYDQSFIDLGCGNGWAVRNIAQKVPTIGLCVGVDVSEELIKEARGLSGAKYPVKFLVAPMEQVPFGESSFNYAFSMEALYYVEDPLAALKAIWKLLKAGGQFHLVIDFYKENGRSAAWQDDIPVKMHFLSQAEWVGLFMEAGFA